MTTKVDPRAVRVKVLTTATAYFRNKQLLVFVLNDIIYKAFDLGSG